MKKLIAATCIALALLGCKKETRTQGSAENISSIEKFPVSFQVSGFKQSVETMSSSKKADATGVELKDHIDRLTYRFYDSKGAFVKTITHDSSYPTFGRLIDSLPQDTYDVVIFGYKGVLNLTDGAPYSFDGFSLDKDRDGATVWDDVFLFRSKITVDKGGAERAVTLNRFLGAFEITIEDAIPATIGKIRVTNYSEDVRYRMNGSGSTGALGGVYKEYLVKPEEVGTKNRTLLFYSASMNTPTKIDIAAYDKNDKLIAIKTIENAKVIANQKTRYSGVLFTTPSALKIGISTDWQPGESTPVRF